MSSTVTVNLDTVRYKSKAGRKRKFTEIEVQELYNALEEYVDNNKDPILAGFCLTPIARKYKCFDDDLYNYPQFYTLVKTAIRKQEVYLTSQTQYTSMAIFRLKQPMFGYTDKIEADFTSGGEPIQFMNRLVRPKKQVIEGKVVKSKKIEA